MRREHSTIGEVRKDSGRLRVGYACGSTLIKRPRQTAVGPPALNDGRSEIERNRNEAIKKEISILIPFEKAKYQERKLTCKNLGRDNGQGLQSK